MIESEHMTDSPTHIKEPEQKEVKAIKKPKPLTPAIPKRLYNIDEAAIYLGRSVGAVREMLWAGKMPQVKDGARIQLDIRDMDAWIEQNKTRTTY